MTHDQDPTKRLLDMLDAPEGPESEAAARALDERETTTLRHMAYARRVLRAAARDAEARAADAPAGDADGLMALIAAEPTPRAGTPSPLTAPRGDDDESPSGGEVISLAAHRATRGTSGGWGFGFAVAAAVAVLLAAAGALLLRDKRPADEGGMTVTDSGKPGMHGTELKRVVGMEAPTGPAFRFAVLPPGAVSLREGFVTQDELPSGQEGFGGYHRELQKGSMLGTSPGTALGLAIDDVTQVELGEGSSLYCEKLTEAEKVLRVVQGTLVSSVRRRDEDPRSTLRLATPDLLAESVGTLYAVSFDADNRSTVEVHHGAVKVTDRNGLGLESVVQGGERLVYHPDAKRFEVVSLESDRFRDLMRPRPLPNEDAKAMHFGVQVLGDDHAAAAWLVKMREEKALAAGVHVPKPSGAAPPDMALRPPPPETGDGVSAKMVPSASARKGDGAGRGPVGGRSPPFVDPNAHAYEVQNTRTAPDFGLELLGAASRERVSGFYDEMQKKLDTGDECADVVNRMNLFMQDFNGAEIERGLFIKGQCLEKLGRGKEANEAYFMYLDRFPHGYWAPDVRKRLFREGAPPPAP